MRRFDIKAALAAAAIAALVAGPAGPAGSGEKILPCADFVGGGARLDTDGTVTFQLATAAPSCPKVTYTISIYDTADVVELPLQTVVLSGDGSSDATGNYLYFSFTPPAEDPVDLEYCFEGSSTRGNKVYDVDPDVGPDGNPIERFCVTFDPDGGSGGTRAWS